LFVRRLLNKICKSYGQSAKKFRRGGHINGINHNIFEQIISLKNLYLAWQEFKRGKTAKPDVQLFAFNLEDNLWQINYELRSGIWQPGPYSAFSINDPKPRRIHKANVRDRVVHQAIYRSLFDIFEPKFIFDSYSCRLNKGTHKAVKRLAAFCRRESRNCHNTIYGLKCDVKKFFDSIDHEILLDLLKKTISDDNTLRLLIKIIKSFSTKRGKGLPLGNVTSQLFANIYLNELDQFVKHKLKVKYYLRYTDDFVFISKDKKYLENLLPPIRGFLENKLALQLHPQKINIRKFKQGLDFLGYVNLPNCLVLRTKTKSRIFKKIKQKFQQLRKEEISAASFNQSLQSYYGILKHCRGRNIRRKVDFLTNLS